MKHCQRAGIFSIVFAVVGLLFFPQLAHADVNNFTITDFTADYSLTKADPQGALDVREQISVNFTDFNHGIERALSQKYNGQDQHLRVSKVLRDGVTENYTTYTSNGNEVLRIGNASKTITGQHTYEIEYHVQNVIRFTKDHDELDWNTNGTGWGQPFEKVTARFDAHAAGVSGKPSQLTCYTGGQGSQVRDCTVSTAGDTTVFVTTRTLQPGENMTFAANFPVGTFAKPTVLDWWKDHAAAVLQIIVPPVLAFAFAYPHWRKHGKDIKGRGTIVPEYAPPDGLRAAEADVINTYGLSTKAVSATIIDLAIRKYLKIIESESKGLLGMGKHKIYTFQKLPAPANDTLKAYEESVLTGLFPAGDTTELDDLKKKFYKTVQDVQSAVPSSLTKDGYFPANPKSVGLWLGIIAGAGFFGAWFIFGADWALAVGLALSAAIVFLFAKLMPSRTQKGVDAKDALEGLKLYMNTAEKDRMAMLQSADAPYAAKTNAPQQTVELFEKLLPYAMVMGVEKTWAKQFEGIYTTPPDWYSGNWAAFNTGYLIGSLSDSMSAMNTSFAAPSSSGAGSGGGFSGGGGGGGGGGGW